MVFDMNNKESQALLAQWEAAKKVEYSLIADFAALNKDGNIDPSIGKQLFERIAAAHNKTMGIEERLQPFRLDE